MILKALKTIIAQSKCRILHALHELRKKRARKTSVLQADSKVAFHTITSSISLFGLSTLRTNHKLCKKLANRKRRSGRHMSLSLGTQTRYCALIRNYTEGLERQRRRQSHKTFMSFRKRREILFRLETQTLTQKVFLWDRSSVMLRKLHTNPSKFFFNRRKTKLEGFVWSFLSITG